MIRSGYFTSLDLGTSIEKQHLVFQSNLDLIVVYLNNSKRRADEKREILDNVLKSLQLVDQKLAFHLKHSWLEFGWHSELHKSLTWEPIQNKKIL